MHETTGPSTPSTASRALSHHAERRSRRTIGPRIRSLGWESLTAKEQEVARLVARGSTNPEIGRRLFITVNTVKSHVDHIYTKLHVTSRAEVGALVTRLERSSGSQDTIRLRTPTKRTSAGEPHNEHFRMRFAQLD